VAELIRLLAVDLADQPRAPTTGAPQRL